MNSFYSNIELKQIGLKSFGEKVMISRKCSIYSPCNISIGNNVRIDDFCILSGEISIGSNIHISAYSALYGSKGIIINDFSGLSPRTTVYSSMDDFSGEFLIGPIHDEHKTNVIGGPVIIDKFVQIGAGSIIFPDLKINEGTVVGAMSLVNKSLEPWSIYVGTPCRKIKNRSKNLLKYV
ncbi:MAG: acyltransferase [Bacteroidales bacterium]